MEEEKKKLVKLYQELNEEDPVYTHTHVSDISGLVVVESGYFQYLR